MNEDESVREIRDGDITQPMYLIDHTCARCDGPPPIPERFEEEEDTVVEEIPWE